MGSMKITIIGHSGSGKSTLATQISERLHIPHLHLDRLWFAIDGHKLRISDVDGKEKARAIMRKQVTEFLETHDAWVSDGWYGKTQLLIAEQADQIIFLDIPLWRRLLNCIYRTFCTKRHPELTKWDDIRHLYHVIRRTYVHRPAIRALLREYADKTIVLHSHAEANTYLAGLH